jgi:hypothetical protein
MFPHECRTTDNESKWVIIDDLQAGPLGAARQRPKGGEVLGDQNLFDVLMRNLPLRLSSMLCKAPTPV